MAHGTPDYALSGMLQNLYSVVDLGELAVRLGSPVRFERLGSVAFFDDFGYGLSPWKMERKNGDEACELRAGKGLWGGYSCSMDGGAGNDPEVLMSRLFPVRVLSNTGVEVGWIGGAAGWHARVAVSLIVYLVSTVVTAGVLWDHEEAKMYLRDSTGAWHLVGSSTHFTTAYQSAHSLKLVIDPLGLAYKRLFVDGMSYDVAGHALFQGVTSTPGLVGVELRITDDLTWGFEYHWGGVAVTVNEP